MKMEMWIWKRFVAENRHDYTEEIVIELISSFIEKINYQLLFYVYSK